MSKNVTIVDTTYRG